MLFDDMGACVSTPQGCVGGKLKRKKNRKRRRGDGLRRRVCCRLYKKGKGSSLDKVDVPGDRSFANNPTFQGSCFLLFFFFSSLLTCCISHKMMIMELKINMNEMRQQRHVWFCLFFYFLYFGLNFVICVCFWNPFECVCQIVVLLGECCRWT